MADKTKDKKPKADSAEHETEDPFLGIEGMLPFDGDEDGDEDAADGLELDDGQAAEIQQVFLTTLPQYLEPVAEMIEQLLTGGEAANAETHQALTATLTSLSEAASRIGVDEVHDLLQAMHARVADLEPNGEPVPPAIRDRILADLSQIEQLAGAQDAGAGTAERSTRSPTVFAALRNVEGVDERALSRLTAAGLVSVDQLQIADPDEIVAVTGLDASVVARILRAVGREVEPEDPSDGLEENVVELPLEAGSLRAQLEQKLHAQVEAEAALEEVQARVKRLRARIATLQEELAAAEERRDQAQQQLSELDDELAERIAALADLRADRGKMARKRELCEEALRREEQRLAELTAEHEAALAEEARFDEGVAGLVEKVERMLESANRW